jgi:hypothetical protein
VARNLSAPLTLLLAALACICIAMQNAPSADAQPNESALVGHLASVESEVIQSYMGKTGTNPPRHYSDGQWFAEGGIECWFCYAAAGTAAGVLYDEGVGGSEYKQVAIETTNATIADHQVASGVFEGGAGPAAINTAFYSVQLGLNYIELQDVLTPSTKSAWSASLAAAAHYLVESGQTTWYINGNINLRMAEVMWLAWKITGDHYFDEQYEAEWAFTIAPPQKRWTGYGLQESVVATDPDGANGAGYLAESDGEAPGFDPEYTMLQLDTATQMYVLSREARWLRLVNLMYDQLIPLVEVTSPPRSAWDLNATGGTRKNEDIPFTTPALYLLVAEGVRPELESGLVAQFTSIENEFQGAMSFTNANLYRDLAEELSTPMLNEQWPAGIDGAQVTTTEGSQSPPEEGKSKCTGCPTAVATSLGSASQPDARESLHTGSPAAISPAANTARRAKASASCHAHASARSLARSSRKGHSAERCKREAATRSVRSKRRHR